MRKNDIYLIGFNLYLFEHIFGKISIFNPEQFKVKPKTHFKYKIHTFETLNFTH